MQVAQVYMAHLQRKFLKRQTMLTNPLVFMLRQRDVTS